MLNKHKCRPGPNPASLREYKRGHFVDHRANNIVHIHTYVYVALFGLYIKWLSFILSVNNKSRILFLFYIDFFYYIV